MKNFWKQSPLWQRKQELGEAFDKAGTAKVDAGKLVLGCIELGADTPNGSFWRDRRQAYLDAAEACDVAFVAWLKACADFHASHAGRAHGRYLKDPLAGTAAESEAA